jgi:hypothetical protein
MFSNLQLAVFSYCISALLSFFVLCNKFATRKDGIEKPKITPGTALFLAVIWPIGMLAAYIAFIRNK